MEIQTVAERLNKRRFIAKTFETVQEAKAAMLDVIEAGSVGAGGSKSINDTGILDELKARGNTVYCHTFVPAEQKDACRRDALGADVYLCSANAVTQDGLIINIDGTGNRVAGTIFGPKTVILLVGKNKLAENVEAGIARIKRETCPKNAARLGLKTPCAVTGKCADCSSPARMCNVTIIHEYPTRNVERFYVFLVNEELGW